MGCWNGTCMISQLPILYHEKVKVIPIQKVSHEVMPNHTICYSDTLYKPLPILLEGQYNDYGIIEFVEGDTQALIDLVVNKSDLTLEEIRNKYTENSDVESCLRYIERDDLDGIGFVMIHEKLFNKLLPEYDGGRDLKTISKAIAELTEDFDKKNVIDITMLHLSEYRNIFGPTVISNCNPKSVESIIRIRSVVEALRKTWIPQSGAGGQSEISGTHIAFLNFYDDYITEHDYEEDDNNEW